MTGIYDGEQGEHPHPPLSRTDEARALADDVAILNGRRRGDIVRVLREQADEIDRLRKVVTSLQGELSLHREM